MDVSTGPIRLASSSWQILTKCSPGRDLDLLALGPGAQLDRLAERLLLDPGEEGLGDLELDVGLEQRHAHVAQRVRRCSPRSARSRPGGGPGPLGIPCSVSRACSSCRPGRGLERLAPIPQREARQQDWRGAGAPLGRASAGAGAPCRCDSGGRAPRRPTIATHALAGLPWAARCRLGRWGSGDTLRPRGQGRDSHRWAARRLEGSREVAGGR